MDYMTFCLKFFKGWVVWVMLIILGACEKMPTDLSTTDSGEIESTIAFKLSDEVVSDLAEIEILVTGGNFTPIREPLEIFDNVARGKVRIKPGPDRLFTVYGYSLDGILTYTGQSWSDVAEDGNMIVEISIRRVDLDAPRKWIEGLIDDLAAISFNSTTQNWDSDAEDDGLSINISFKNSNGDSFFWSGNNITVRVDYVAYISKSFEEPDKRKYENPWIRHTGYVSSSSDDIKIPYEQIPEVKDEDIVKSGDYWAVRVIEELSITMSDGSRYYAKSRPTSGYMRVYR